MTSYKTNNPVAFLLVLAIIVAYVIAGPWLFMLAVGVVHAELLPAVIPAGFWPCTLVWALLSLAFWNKTSSK